MKPAVLDIDIYKGDHTDVVLRFRTRVYNAQQGGYVAGDYINLTGFTGKAQVRPIPGSESLLAEWAVVLADQSNPDTVGGIVMTLTGAQTAILPVGTAYWDFQLTNPEGEPRTYVGGAAQVIADVTR